MVQVYAAVLAALASAAVALAQPPATATSDVFVTGCLQRAPDPTAPGERFVLMNAGPSPMGADVPGDVTPPEPGRSAEPVEHHPGASDVRQETGGVMYLLVGGKDLDSKVGQRVEVEGTPGPRVTAPMTRPSHARPLPKLKVTHARAIAPHC